MSYSEKGDSSTPSFIPFFIDRSIDLSDCGDTVFTKARLKFCQSKYDYMFALLFESAICFPIGVFSSIPGIMSMLLFMISLL